MRSVKKQWTTPGEEEAGGETERHLETADRNGGGSLSTGGDTLSGTIGQADAGTVSGGGYTLTGGFWASASALYLIHLPLIMR